MTRFANSGTQSPLLDKAEKIAAVVITLAVICFHLVTATSAGPLWRDEAAALGLATSPTLGEVWNNLQHEAFPILWPLLIREFSSLVGPMNDSAFRAHGKPPTMDMDEMLHAMDRPGEQHKLGSAPR
ncbi:MAG TPA: hypothetical protein VES88_08775 [Gemmatimonadaceae bacterium]|nr:hypothetical protein [Gemmatimonadaceae bacterium]